MNAQPATNYFGPRTIVTVPGGKPFEVKNLGWLLRHASEVDSIDLDPRDDGARCGCRLIALLNDGKTYRTAFDSVAICREWVKRRCLSHAVVRDNLPPEAR